MELLNIIVKSHASEQMKIALPSVGDLCDFYRLVLCPASVYFCRRRDFLYQLETPDEKHKVQLSE